MSECLGSAGMRGLVRSGGGKTGEVVGIQKMEAGEDLTPPLLFWRSSHAVRGAKGRAGVGVRGGA
ncbi:hypothetical protein E2C01_080029 [Portunus trituberculatus]|uniref:Uncharacterized protein n=1 Tax=Portunus trituberculatus TaxID=210409 RepID=A0A5B7IYG2_PORTR|nr:hypothetical protein [Portunus trituberculatus]